MDPVTKGPMADGKVAGEVAGKVAGKEALEADGVDFLVELVASMEQFLVVLGSLVFQFHFKNPNSPKCQQY